MRDVYVLATSCYCLRLNGPTIVFKDSDPRSLPRRVGRRLGWENGDCHEQACVSATRHGHLRAGRNIPRTGCFHPARARELFPRNVCRLINVRRWPVRRPPWAFTEPWERIPSLLRVLETYVRHRSRKTFVQNAPAPDAGIFEGAVSIREKEGGGGIPEEWHAYYKEHAGIEAVKPFASEPRCGTVFMDTYCDAGWRGT